MFIAVHNGARAWGGAERAVALLLAGLQARGHRVLMYCGEPAVARRAAALGVPVRRVRLGGDVAVPHALRFARVLRADRPDVLVAGTFRKLWLVALAGRLAGVPRIVARVGLQTDRPRSFKYRWVLRRWVSSVVVNSDFMRPPFLEVPGWTPERVATIHNGVHPPRRPAEPGRLRASLGIPPDAPVVGALARLELQKHLYRLIGATARLSVPAHCVIAGEGEKLAELQALADRLGIAARVHFVGFREEVGEVLEALDALVICSNREGMSSAMLEAMAAGVPVISTRVSGAEEALAPLPDGTRPGEIVGFQVEEIAAALDRLLADPAGRRRMGEAARHRFQERFRFDSMVDRWERLLAAERALPLPVDRSASPAA